MDKLLKPLLGILIALFVVLMAVFIIVPGVKESKFSEIHKISVKNDVKKYKRTHNIMKYEVDTYRGVVKMHISLMYKDGTLVDEDDDDREAIDAIIENAVRTTPNLSLCGMKRIERRILKSLNKLKDGKIERIYYTKFLIL